MKRHSIRWRLPLSYAAIAFLAALALGVVLRMVLADYYAEQERSYLERNARSFSRMLSNAWTDDLEPQRLATQLEMLAFLAQTRIRLVDTDGQLLVDSGSPDEPFLSVTYETLNPPPNIIALNSGWFLDRTTNTLFFERPWEITEPASLAEILAAAEGGPTTTVFSGASSGHSPVTIGIVPAIRGEVIVQQSSYWPVSRTPYGFSVGSELEPRMQQKRSDETVTVALHDPLGRLIGAVQISEGPAIGSEILDSVTRAWVYAGGFAVLMAATAGWIVSRQITTPLIALTTTTTAMASGDLSVRTNIHRRDELGILASSFDTMAGRIEDTVTALQRFVADAAHELHTPLTALRTDLELIGETQENRSIEPALIQIGRLQSLADDLLDLSRIESDYPHLTHVPADLRAIVQNTSVVFASRAEQADIDFSLDLAAATAIVQGNPAQLERMVGNLLDNAVKFTPPGGTITVRLIEEGQGVTLVVQDTGIGIPDEDLPYLFSRFRRGRNTAGHPGSGLGLAIVKAVADAHQATISAENGVPGVQMTVHFPLP